MAHGATKPRVIVVDDERLIADTLTLILNLNGYQALGFHRGEHAVEWAKHSRPDIVLSDIRMHPMNGVLTTLLIRVLHPGCRCILFSAFGISEAEKARINKAGFEFLTRPLHPKQVLEHLRSITIARVIPFRPELSEWQSGSEA
jgi:DNA-binding response OmpR family regulator